MSDHSGLPPDIKKIKFFEDLLVTLGGKEGVDKKVMFKDLSQENVHFTMKLMENTLDFHKTFEGKPGQKNWEPLAKIDMASLTNIDLNQLSSKTNPEELKAKFGLKEIDISAPEYSEYFAIPIDDRGTPVIRKKEAHYKDMSSIPGFKLAQLAEKGYERVFALNNDGEKFCVFKGQDAKYYSVNFDGEVLRWVFSILGFDYHALFSQLGMDSAEFDNLIADKKSSDHPNPA